MSTIKRRRPMLQLLRAVDPPLLAALPSVLRVSMPMHGQAS
jgi:hypothetical protein